MSSEFKKANIVGGNFQASDGSPLSNGWLVFRLSHDGNISVLGAPTGIQVTAGIQVVMTLDTLGNLNPNQFLWSNDLLTPSGSYYKVTAYNSNGIAVWNFPQIFFLQPYQATINIGTQSPLIP